MAFLMAFLTASLMLLAVFVLFELAPAVFQLLFVGFAGACSCCVRLSLPSGRGETWQHVLRLVKNCLAILPCVLRSG